jgi:hypothetical protein
VVTDKCLHIVVQTIANFNQGKLVLVVAECIKFQKNLIVLLLLVTGGQRKQVIALFIASNLTYDEQLKSYFYKPHSELEKTLRAQSAKGFPVPKWLGDAILFLEDKVKPVLLENSEVDVQSAWVTEEGLPLQSKEFTEWVRLTIRSHLPQPEDKPQKNVTPAVIRRSIPTNFIMQAFKDGQDISLIKENLAILLNTSINMIDSYYDRSSNSLRMSSFLTELNSSVVSPGKRVARLQKRLQTELDDSKTVRMTLAKDSSAEEEANQSEEESSEDDDQLVSGVHFVEKILDERISKDQVELKVKWKNYPVSEATWEPIAELLHCREVLSKWFAIENPSQLKKKVPKKKKKSLTVRAKKSKK